MVDVAPARGLGEGVAQRGRLVGGDRLDAVLERDALRVLAVDAAVVGDVRAAERGQRDVARRRREPLGLDLVAALERRVGRQAPELLEHRPVADHRARPVDLGGGERAAALVVDERVERDPRAEAGGLDAQAEVVVLEVAGAEALLEAADAVERVAPGEQAEADDARDGRGLAAAARPRARRRRRSARPGRRTGSP